MTNLIRVNQATWHKQAVRNPSLAEPHVFSSPIMGDWRFVCGYNKPTTYERLRPRYESRYFRPYQSGDLAVHLSCTNRLPG